MLKNIGYCAYIPCFSWPVPMIWPAISSDLDLPIQLPVTASRIPLQSRSTHALRSPHPYTPHSCAPMTLHLFGTCWTRVGLSSVPFESVLFHQTSAHGAFILRVLLRVEWLQGGSASTLDGDWLLCACSLFVGSCCLVFSFVSSED